MPNLSLNANLDVSSGTGAAKAKAVAIVLADGTLLKQPNTFKDVATIAAGSIVTVWTPTAGTKVRLMGGCLSASAACSLLFEDNAAASAIKFRTPKLAADSPYNFDIPGGLLLSAVNNVLKLTSSAAANVTGTLWGVEE